MSQEFDKKVVFLGTSSSVFVVRTAEELRVRGVDVQLIDPYEAAFSELQGRVNLPRRCGYYTERGSLAEQFGS